MRNVWWICKAWPPPLLLEASFEPSYASLQRPPEISPLLLSPSPEPRMVTKRNTPTLPTHHYHFLLTGLLARAAARPAIREAIRCNWGPWEKRLNSYFGAENQRMQRHLVKTQRFDPFLCDVVRWQLDKWNLTKRYMAGILYQQSGLHSAYHLEQSLASILSVLLTLTPARRPELCNMAPHGPSTIKNQDYVASRPPFMSYALLLNLYTSKKARALWCGSHPSPKPSDPLLPVNTQPNLQRVVICRPGKM